MLILFQVMTIFPREQKDPYLLSIFMSLKTDKAKPLGFATVIRHDPDTEGRP